jgi:hypothetical protein
MIGRLNFVSKGGNWLWKGQLRVLKYLSSERGIGRTPQIARKVILLLQQQSFFNILLKKKYIYIRGCPTERLLLKGPSGSNSFKG